MKKYRESIMKVVFLVAACVSSLAVVMIAGNQTVLPKSLLSGVRTMTANIVMEMGYATDLHRGALIGTGVVLFIFILLINVCFSLVKKKETK